MRMGTNFARLASGVTYVLLFAGAARAQSPVAPVPTEVPGGFSEMKAIEPIFGDVTLEWKGNVEAGAMGPGSAATHSQGKAASRRILDHAWSVCEFEEKYGEGKAAVTWKAQMVVGFDTIAKAYKAVLVDNSRSMTSFDGRMEGRKFVLETSAPVLMMGQLMKDRLTWDMTDPRNIQFTDEHQPVGGAWALGESATLKMTMPVAKGTGLHVTK